MHPFLLILRNLTNILSIAKSKYAFTLISGIILQISIRTARGSAECRLIYDYSCLACRLSCYSLHQPLKANRTYSSV